MYFKNVRFVERIDLETVWQILRERVNPRGKVQSDYIIVFRQLTITVLVITLT